MALYKDVANESKMDLRIAGRNDELFQVHRFSGSEGISQLFRFEIDLVSTERGLLPSEITGQPAVLVLRDAPGPKERRFRPDLRQNRACLYGRYAVGKLEDRAPGRCRSVSTHQRREVGLRFT